MTHLSKIVSTTVATLISIVLVAAMFITSTMSASAATYAYVDAVGEVKSVVADTWMAAIISAPNIHKNSGVMLLRTAADFTIIGDDVKSI